MFLRGWFGLAVTAFVINEVKLRRARLVLGLVTTYGGSTIPEFIQATQAHSAWPSLRGQAQWAPEMVSAISGKKRRLWSYDRMAHYKSVYKYIKCKYNTRFSSSLHTG